MFTFFFGVLGRFLFGPIGGFLFTLLGNALFGKKSKTPKLEELQYQDANYGSSIYYSWGTTRLGGTVFWPKYLKLRPHKIEGEKGGVLFFEYQKTPDIPTRKATWGMIYIKCPYIYDDCYAVEELVSIRMNGKLVYDVSDTASAQFRSDSEAMLWKNENGVRIYYGTPDQPISYFVSVDQYSKQIAYRHRFYIIFVDWILHDFGDTLPEINVVTTKRGYRKPNFWYDRTELNYSVIKHTAIVAFDLLFFVGGIKWNTDDGDYAESGESIGYTIDEDGYLTSSDTKPLNQERYNHGIVLLTGTFNLFGSVEPRLVVIGGVSGLSEAAPTPIYYADAYDGYMMEEKAEGGNWTSCAVIADQYGITLGRLPLPRDSFGCVYYERHDGWHPFNRCTFIFCGRNSRSGAGGSDYTGPGNSFRDCWAWNGGTFFLLTRVSDGESVDCGLGYRLFPASCQHGNHIFAGGGLTMDEAGNPSNARDVYKMLIFADDEAFGAVNKQVSFVCVCSDILLNSPEWPAPEQWCISKLFSFRGQLVASVMDSGSNTICFFRSTDGNGMIWEYWHKGKYTILSTTSNSYTVAGDQTENISSDDTITVVDDGVTNNKVESVYYNESTDRTTITCTLSNTTEGILYVDYISKKELTNYKMLFDIWDESSVYPDDVTITPYKGRVVVRGSNVPGNRGTLNTFVANPPVVETYQIPLSEPVRDCCALSGIGASHIDFDDLTQLLYGFASGKDTNKNRIETFRQYGFFDIIQKGDIVTGVNRGGNIVGTIDADYLGAQVVKSGESPKPIDKSIITTKNPKSKPYRVDVKYLSIELGLQPGIQSSPIRNDSSIGNRIITVDIPIVMSDAKASQIAECLLYECDFQDIEIKVPNLFLKFYPTNPISVITDNETFRVLINDVTYTSEGIVEIQGRIEDTSIYSSKQIGASASDYVPPSTERIDVTGMFLDIPWFYGVDDFTIILGCFPTDSDDAEKFTLVDVYYYDTGLSVPYKYLGSINNYLHYGTISTALPAGSKTGMDNTNKPVVTMVLGELSSGELAGVLGSGVNLVAIGSPTNGWELLSFVDAVDLGSNQYRLERLLRYQYGTDYIVHQNDEYLVVLDTTKLLRLVPGVNALNKSLQFLLVPNKGVVTSVDPVSFTPTFVCKKPFSPINLTGVKLSNGVWKFTWERRVRGTVTWTNTSIPLQETLERYELDFYSQDGLEVLHTRVIDVVYLNPNRKPYCYLDISDIHSIINGKDEIVLGQSSIYGGEVSSIKVGIYQMSIEIGRGFGEVKTF